MKFSYSWLKEYAKDLPSPQELLEKLPLSSVEVEEIEEQGARLENIIVGEVRHIEKHPNADRLAVCTVHTGAAQEQIVCGGSNLFVGMKVAFAKVGSRVEWHGKGEMVEMKPATIRGVKSNGMICTSDEIGLIKLFPKKEENEVIDLTAHSFVSGTPLAEALGLNDTLIDIDNKSMTHRGDLFCHIGMSREMAAVFNVPFNMPQFSEFDTASLPKVDIAVEDATDCPRYMGIEMDVTIADAPEFIKKRLNACGVKSINNVVDITNYVMLELDQPLHAFDVEKVGGKKIIVRRAKKGESMMTLDDVVKELDPSILVIADEQKPMAVAGVIGGRESGISENTKRIILEIANFHPILIRKAARAIATRTESAVRFEKNLPVAASTLAAARAVELLKQYADAKIVAFNDTYPVDLKTHENAYRPTVELTAAQLTRLMGVALPGKTIIELLSRLGCSVSEQRRTDGVIFDVSPPWFRQDLNIPEDIVEEVARLYGLHRIPEQKLSGELHVPAHEPIIPAKREVRNILQGFGLTEVYNYSFYGEELITKAGLQTDKEHIEILNPLSDDLRYLRVSLLPRLLENVALNQQQKEFIAFFELGHVYFADREVQQLGIVVANKQEPYRRVRGIVEALLQKLHIAYNTEVISQNALCEFWGMYQNGQALRIDVAGKISGTIGEVDTTILNNFDIHTRVGFATISLDLLAQYMGTIQQVKSISPYPTIDLDLSLIVPQTVSWGEIENVVRAQAGELLQSIQVLDVYVGGKIPAGKKSIAFRVIMQSQERTLEMKEMEQWREQLVKKLEKQFGAQLRAV